MRILCILILTLVAAYFDQVSGKKAIRKGPNKGGPCGKPFLRQLNGRCYYVSTKKMNWFGAQNNCLRKELNLADVSTPADFRALSHYLQIQVGFDDYWIGGNDLQTEGRFSYISSGKLIRYMGENSMVEPTQRSNLNDCLELRIRSNHTVILDVNCHLKNYFLCEKSQDKCARPTEDEDAEGGQQHSHEHLHHFHHDAGKKEKEDGKKVVEEVESDSRPLDNSNSTEIGVSAETQKPSGAGEETTKGSEEDDESTTTPAPESTTAAGTTEAAGDATSTTGAAGDAAEAVSSTTAAAVSSTTAAADAAAAPAADAAAAPAANAAAAPAADAAAAPAADAAAAPAADAAAAPAAA